jgi:phosphoserine phosphatase SerB
VTRRPCAGVLLDAAAAHGVDVAVQPERLERRAKRLVVLDVDSTLIRDEVIELIADEVGCRDEVAAITARAMEGGLDFVASLRARVALLAGADVAALDRAAARVRLTPGARTLVGTLKRLGYTVAVVSGGFDHVVDPIAAELGIDHAVANRLEVVDGRLTGGLVGPILDRAGKARELVRIAAHERVPLEQTVAIGDGANDLDMIAAAGLGVAFNAKPVVRAAADTSVNVPRLDAILFLLGIPADEIVQDPDDDEPIAGPHGTVEPAAWRSDVDRVTLYHRTALVNLPLIEVDGLRTRIDLSDRLGPVGDFDAAATGRFARGRRVSGWTSRAHAQALVGELGPRTRELHGRPAQGRREPRGRPCEGSLGGVGLGPTARPHGSRMRVVTSQAAGRPRGPPGAAGAREARPDPCAGSQR